MAISRKSRTKMSLCFTQLLMLWYVATANMSVWQAVLGEKLKCVREAKDRSDVFAVAVGRVGVTVRHLA